MQNHWQMVWEFKTARFRVALEADYEYDQDLSWADAETLDKLERGVWTNYTFRLVVQLDGHQIAADYLGNSIYADAREFYKEHIGIRALRRTSGKNYGCYFEDMVKQAIGEARTALANMPTLRHT